MDHYLKDYYRQFSDEAPRGQFHKVIALHQAPDISWEAITEIVPNLPRGWFELANLNTKDRIEFLRDFWLAKLPYRQGFDEFIVRFFNSLDDIGIFITQKTFDDPYQPQLVYSLKDDNGFFKGLPPADDASLTALKKAFPQALFPNDYMAFLQIHNGFCKATDCTGVLPAELVTDTYQTLCKSMQQQEPILTSRETIVDPTSLIPFYKSFGMPYYQCFWTEWYPEGEMGNVYYSGEARTISDAYSGGTSSEKMAFPTFVDWLTFYLERIE